MNPTYLSAVRAADKSRLEMGLNMYEPANVFEMCNKLDVTLRFLDISMEGMYIKSDNSVSSTIILSNKRPFARRNFTCAHELGHHYYGHGSKVEALSVGAKYDAMQDNEELLANVFASNLLMPTAGINSQFFKRGWNPNLCTPLEFYSISSYFGVGYRTLIWQCSANNIISNARRLRLLKYSPGRIFRESMSDIFDLSHYKIIGNLFPKIIDLEVDNYLILSKEVQEPIDCLELKQKRDLEIIYKCVTPGVYNLYVEGNKKCILRIQKKDYIGLAEYRN